MFKNQLKIKLLTLALIGSASATMMAESVIGNTTTENYNGIVILNSHRSYNGAIISEIQYDATQDTCSMYFMEYSHSSGSEQTSEIESFYCKPFRDVIAINALFTKHNLGSCKPQQKIIKHESDEWGWSRTKTIELTDNCMCLHKSLEFQPAGDQVTDVQTAISYQHCKEFLEPLQFCAIQIAVK